ncbi:MAG: iron-containing alcohol dehydrogenase [Muribaculaceae bacterium]|nr:iron-containing alcohol dehydrogenase [Muribaculaceae bacterium]
MKGNFVYCNPTKIYFGDKAQENLSQALSSVGDKVLLVYGNGSIKRNGVYDDVKRALNDAHKKVVELCGVMPNPTLEKLEEGRAVAKENNIDFILAVGGGSVIDYAKSVGVSAWYEGDVWQNFWVNQNEPEEDAKIIPVGAVLTMSGTGSEMNGGTVITNTASKMKLTKVFGSRVMPKFAILNPRYTFSLPKYQMVAGIYDTFSHIMEQYFSDMDGDSTSDYISEGLMRSVIASSRVAMNDPENYEARSNLMWASSLALNTLIGRGKKQDWMPHMIGKAISAHTDATHGMTLSAIAYAYYRHVMPFGLSRFARFARVVWGIPAEGKTEQQLAEEGIEALKDWINEIGAASDILSLGVTNEMIPAIADSTIINEGGFKKLSKAEVIEILEASTK